MYYVYALAVHFWCLMHLYRRINDTLRMAPLNCCYGTALKHPQSDSVYFFLCQLTQSAQVYPRTIISCYRE